ncbi:B3 domain-containing protein Os01g0723500-like [Pyrus communis]|uniref:B3 domain-containing protein Os01g0723500-like n=1 Tax=Pyrus communis TaxID=23211 RepID=UPI0035C13105
MDEKLKEALETPAFRALLVGDFSKHLRIPPAFIKNFGGRSLRKCTLRNPSGDCWGVKLKQKEDGLFFRKGWKVFVKDHFLEHGDFLVFEYGGGSEFDVTIFDRTCCEKNVEEAARRASSNLADSRTGELYTLSLISAFQINHALPCILNYSDIPVA